MIHFLCGEFKKKLSENFFKYLFSNRTATKNKLNGGILVTHFSDFKYWYSKQIQTKNLITV